MRIHVEVKQDDIDQGRRGDFANHSGGCMVYRAFQRATEGAFEGTRACYSGIEVNIAGEPVVFNYPPARADELYHAIRLFDAGHPVSPFSFDLDVEVPQS